MSTAQQQLKYPCVINTVSSTNPKYSPLVSTMKKIISVPAKTYTASQEPLLILTKLFCLLRATRSTHDLASNCLSGSEQEIPCPNTKLILVWQYFSGCVLLFSKPSSPRKNASFDTSMFLQISCMHLLCKTRFVNSICSCF